MFWKIISWIVTQPYVTDWLIWASSKTPYTRIVREGREVYMYRYWLFNPYDNRTHKKRFQGLPSIRLHKIMLPDDGPEHNHPWHARSIILRGAYWEVRGNRSIVRARGQTFTLKPTDYHRISAVSPGGCWTLFFTWQRYQNWGFRK